MKFLQHLKQDSGAGIVEYGLIVALIAIVSLTSVKALGLSTSESLTTSAQSISHSDNADDDTTTTTEPASDTSSTTTTSASGSGGSGGSGSGGSDDGEDSGDSGGGTTTTTAPPATTTTTTAPATTTTTAPEYPTAVAAVKGKVTVTYGYLDKKVVVVDTQTEGEWSVKITSESDDRINLEFTNTKTGSVVTTEGYVKNGELKTKAKAKAK